MALKGGKGSASRPGRHSYVVMLSYSGVSEECFVPNVRVAEDRGGEFLRNVRRVLRDYKLPHVKRGQFCVESLVFKKKLCEQF